MSGVIHRLGIYCPSIHPVHSCIRPIRPWSFRQGKRCTLGTSISAFSIAGLLSDYPSCIRYAAGWRTLGMLDGGLVAGLGMVGRVQVVQCLPRHQPGHLPQVFSRLAQPFAVVCSSSPNPNGFLPSSQPRSVRLHHFAVIRRCFPRVLFGLTWSTSTLAVQWCKLAPVIVRLTA